jgi:ketosteroid isomerase-like protein
MTLFSKYLIHRSYHHRLSRETAMRNLLPFVIALGLLAGCAPKVLTPEQVAQEKEAIKAAIASYHKGYETKDVEIFKNLISSSPDFMFFGTDVAEVIKSSAEMDTQKEYDFQLFESAKFGETQDLAIQVSSDGDLASAVYQVPIELKTGGETSNATLRFAFTFRKENGWWKIVQGVAAMATTGQSSAELVKKMHETKAK